VTRPSSPDRALGGPARPQTAREHRLFWAGCLRARWLQWRNGLLSSPRFQRWAARFPLTRFVARRRASALFDLCAGFVYSQVLLASVQAGLFELLAAGPLTLEELSPRLSLRPEAARRLLDAASSLRLAERLGPGFYGLGIHGAALLGNPAVSEMVKHHALVYRDLAEPLRLLRGEGRETELGRFWTYAGAGVGVGAGGGADGYSELMARSLSLVAEDVLEAYPVGRHRKVLDVAGGEGAFLEAIAARDPGPSLLLFELPDVAHRARARLARAGLAGRAEVLAGDLFLDPLPEGADLITLLRVLHDHDDDRVLQLLRAVRRALRPGGVLLIAEPMSDTPGAAPMGDAYFGFYLLAMGQGRPRSPVALCELLREAGFARARSLPTRRPLLTQLLVAEAAGAESKADLTLSAVMLA
jgi:demethylspheroidene O-methyltransferase